MITITREIVRVYPHRIADRFKAQQFVPSGDRWLGQDSESKYHRLKNLPQECTAAEVNAIIGNDSWAGTLCEVCKNTSTDILSIKSQWETTTAVCLSCARDIAAVLSATCATCQFWNAPSLMCCNKASVYRAQTMQPSQGCLAHKELPRMFLREGDGQ